MAETINMPKLGFDMAEGLLVRWVKQVGENINKGDVLAEIETDKATVEVESSASGVVLSHIVDQGSIVPVNAPIAIVGAEGEKVDAPAKVESGKSEVKADEKPAPQSAPTAAPVAQTSAPAESGPVKASPLAKKIAREKNINLSSIQGTGPNGRISRKDVEAALSSGATSDL
ncbi:MAG TPA: pyruvate dehydrogenase complex dihydrolipoamide acetyltransferase, partial [Anaerolineae bacterium]|nr:pyruvate dehydrogenase complex dihydrolipoamide acetyltransferase [Anaerolineae bacterium]